REFWPPPFLHPCAAPRGNVLRGSRVENAHQVEPCGVAEGIPLQVLPQPVTKRLFAEHRLELAHDDRRLLIDDRPVELSRLVQIDEVLTDWIGARCSIDLISRRIVREQKPEAVVHL